jgi:hypothetical protein
MEAIRKRESEGKEGDADDDFDKIDHNAENMILLGILTPNVIEERKRFMLYPDDTFYIYWDMFISLILLISCMITPLNFAF